MNAKDNPALKRLSATLPNSPLTVLAPTNAIVTALKKAAHTQSGQKIPSRPFLNFSAISGSPSCTIVGPAVGSPAAVLALEPFLQNPGTRIGLMGTCGGIQGADCKLEIGDFVIPTGAMSEEGTSQHYGGNPTTDFYAEETQSILIQQLERSRKLSSSNGQLRQGRVWTTDVPYLERPSKVDRYRTSGAIAVDMEFSAVLQLSRSYKVPFAAAFVVSDIVSDQSASGFRSPQLKHSVDVLARAMIELSTQLANT